MTSSTQHFPRGLHGPKGATRATIAPEINAAYDRCTDELWAKYGAAALPIPPRTAFAAGWLAAREHYHISGHDLLEEAP
jgi:hypothetical protein